MRTWISLLPPPPLLLTSSVPVSFPFAAAVVVVSSVVAVKECDGGGGEWRFGSPFRAKAAAIAAATADAACSIIPAAAAFREGTQFLKVEVEVAQFELKERKGKITREKRLKTWVLGPSSRRG